ncbi:ficolin-2 [Lingula anatina]|uniref:Ficolin-2 n=1 Tax=Lingula anatina TaxID=7574 RepID=A0A1S3IA18_LINAN|nr:ficolin-2 [Lingula anatina]|eukprot:XP_013395018.1 ficolin-2 [Lingula anatina]
MAIFWLVIGLGLLRTSESIPPTLQPGAPVQYCSQQQCTDISTTLKALLTDQQTAKGKDCAELYKGGIRRSGVYTINLLNGGGDVDVYCDMKTDGGGWTVFQRRMDGSVDFYRDWAAYKYGFGNLNGEHWLGNKYIHLLSNQGPYELRVDLEAATREKGYAKFAYFAIGDETVKYRLTAGAFSGNIGDSFSQHSGDPFTTKDNDNDEYSGNVRCSTKEHGGTTTVTVLT